MQRGGQLENAESVAVGRAPTFNRKTSAKGRAKVGGRASLQSSEAAGREFLSSLVGAMHLHSQSLSPILAAVMRLCPPQVSEHFAWFQAAHQVRVPGFE